MLLNRLHTVFGWTVRVGPDAKPRSLRNFPCQANGAEMMRLACCLATERGVNVVAPVHDALMIEGPADAIDEIAARTQEAMAEASAVVLDGFRLRSDANIVRWPDRYMDGRGREFWGRVMKLRNEKFEIETSRKNTPGRLAGVVPTSSTLPCLTTNRREGSTKRQRRELSMCPHEAC
jgi:DNA polymerase I